MQDISKMTKPVFVTENGIKLYIDNEMVKIFNSDIKRLDLKNVQAFFAVHPNGDKEYLLVKDGKPFHASQRAEDIGSQIDMLAVVEKYGDEQHEDNS